MGFILHIVVSRWIQNGTRVLSRRQASILSAAFVIMTAYAASGVLGLFRNRLLAHYFFSGRERELDAYFAAFVLPDTIFQLLILGALSAAFIPVFTEYLKKNKEEAWHIAGASMTNIFLLFSAIAAILFLFAEPASRMLAPNFGRDQILLTANLTRIMLGAQFFFALSAFMTGILQSHHRFLLPAIAPVFYNLGIIAGILLLTPVIGIYGAAVGVVFGAAMHVVIQLPLAVKLGYRPRPIFDLRHPAVERIKRLMPARAATLAVDQLERVLAVTLTSALSAGTLTLFNFARQLYVLPISLFGSTVGQASFPTLSHAHDQKNDEFVRVVSSTLLQIVFFTLPAAILLLVLRIPAVRLTFGARTFPWEATLLTGKAVAIFAFSVPAQSINQLLIRTFYAAQNTRTPFIAAMIAAALMLVVAPLLSNVIGLGLLGIVAAIVVADIVEMIFLVLLLQKQLSVPVTAMIIGPLRNMVVAATSMGIILWILLRFLDRFIFDTTRTLPLLGLTVVASALGLTVYLFIAKLLRVQELQTVMRLVHHIGNWRKILEETEETLEPATT